MDRERFEQLVERAIKALPEEFIVQLENIVIVIDDQPTPAQLAKAGIRRGESLFGLYEGVPLTKRGTHYGLVPPDRIIIFQKPIEFHCRDEAEITATVERVVQHEIAHHFGINDDRLKQLRR